MSALAIGVMTTGAGFGRAITRGGFRGCGVLIFGAGLRQCGTQFLRRLNDWSCSFGRRTNGLSQYRQLRGPTRAVANSQR